MRQRPFLRLFYLPILFLAAGFIADAVHRTVVADEPIVVKTATLALPDITGQWKGRWTDTRYSATDSVQFTIAVNGNQVSGTGTLGLMNEFGLPDEQGTIAGTISGNQLSFTFTTNTATGGGTIIDMGLNDGVGNIGGLLGFGGYTFTGTVDNSNMTWDFTFDSPTGGWGSVVLDRVGVENASGSVSELKSRFDG